VCEGERPEPQVGGCVGDATEHVLDRVDHLGGRMGGIEWGSSWRQEPR
jgi:hypothetical protein